MRTWTATARTAARRASAMTRAERLAPPHRSQGSQLRAAPGRSPGHRPRYALERSLLLRLCLTSPACLHAHQLTVWVEPVARGRLRVQRGPGTAFSMPRTSCSRSL